MEKENRLKASPVYITTQELADMLGVCRSTIRNLRAAGKAPEHVKIGRCVRYDLDKAIAWIDSQAA